MIREWLELKPAATAKELLGRLQRDRSGEFPDHQLRTLQRRVSEWRSLRVRALIFGEPQGAKEVANWLARRVSAGHCGKQPSSPAGAIESAIPALPP
jgi:hypothetical protein